jgi:UDP-glucose 4-epimerase
VRILVTGGSGYVGSHVARFLHGAGHKVFVIDRVADQRKWVNPGISHFTGDIADYQGMDKIFKEYNFEAVIHLAASSEVGASVNDPLFYYANNVANSALLLNICDKHNVRKLVFSSTSSVYGEVEPSLLPTQEWYEKNPLTSYGSSKLCVEHMLRDVDRAHNIRSVSLRYFNASGACPDGAIGEFREKPSHLIPSLAAVAHGKQEEFVINGDDYDTPDGTAVRDYTHVWDIARAHGMALDYLDNNGKTTAINIGAGQGKSVLEVLNEFQTQWGTPIFFRSGPRRPGDIPINYADISRAKELLGWKPELSSTEQIVKDAIRWYRSELYMRLINA